ncbi:MAG: hypothetical protein K0S74_178 [Chlamydiales bacterium]|jgi:outer membrane protein W|nr:hypothetical protein [Chlamydiales bacterium]
MNKKILLAIVGLLSASAIQAENVFNAGMSVGYRQTGVKSTKKSDTEKYSSEMKGAKNVMLNGHFNGLIDDQFYVEGGIHYGVHTGKTKNVNKRNGVKLNQNKSKSKLNPFEGEALFGYQFNIAEGVSLTPVVGYGFQRLHVRHGKDTLKTLHTPVAGLKMTVKPSDDFAIRASFTYGKPKVKSKFKDMNLEKRANQFKTTLGLDYKMDEAWGLSLEGSYAHAKAKKQTKPAGVKVKSEAKVCHWDVAFGATVGF